MAQEPADIDDRQLKELMRFKPSLKDAAAIFDCHTRTIQRHIEEKHQMTFKAFRERYMANTRLGLVRKALEKAENGDNVMIIFCLKNLCGWKDAKERVRYFIDGQERSEREMKAEIVQLLHQKKQGT